MHYKRQACWVGCAGCQVPRVYLPWMTLRQYRFEAEEKLRQVSIFDLRVRVINKPYCKAFWSWTPAHSWVYLLALTTVQVHVLHQVLILSGKSGKETAHQSLGCRQKQRSEKTITFICFLRVRFIWGYFSLVLSQNIREVGGGGKGYAPIHPFKFHRNFLHNS